MPKKLNGYAKMLFEVKKQEGDDVPMERLQMIASEKWNKMGADARAKYSGKKPVGGTEPTKYNCLGYPVKGQLQIIQEKRLQEEKITKIINDILQKAISKEMNGIYNQIFYFFSASYFVKKNNEDIYPAELALAKFSIRGGIIDKMHMLINPGALPLGYAGDAIHHAKRTHRFELPPNIEGEKSYKVMMDKIMKFIGTDRFTSEHIPPFFCFSDCEGDDQAGAELTLAKIASENGEYNAFRVYKAEVLLFLLHKEVIENRNAFFDSADKPFASMTLAWDSIRHDNFRYSSIGCKQHNADDNSTECCLSKVQRLGFNFAQYCLDGRMDKIAGQHYPAHFVLPELHNEHGDDEDDDYFGDLESKSSNLTANRTASFRQLSKCSSVLSRITLESTKSRVSQSSSTSSRRTLRVRKFKSDKSGEINMQMSDLSIDRETSQSSIDYLRPIQEVDTTNSNSTIE